MMDKLTPGELDAELRHYQAGETLYRHSLSRRHAYTEGVKFLAEQAGAYWLIDTIILVQNIAHVGNEEFQVWRLKVEQDRSASLVMDDGNGEVRYIEKIRFTDFPLAEVKLWLENRTLMLPSER